MNLDLMILARNRLEKASLPGNGTSNPSQTHTQIDSFSALAETETPEPANTVPMKRWLARSYRKTRLPAFSLLSRSGFLAFSF